MIRFHPYRPAQDYARVSAFLLEHYLPGNQDGNWLEPAWEYMHSHPYLDSSSLDRIGIWEKDGKITAVAHYECGLGEAFFQLDPAFRSLFPHMLDHAETALAAASPEGRVLRACINDNAPDLSALAAERGYTPDPSGARPLSRFTIPQPFPPITLPPGYRLKSLADDCDWRRVHRVLWRGFDHPGEPPEDGLAEREAMQNTPNFRHDLKIVVEAPNGDFAAFCGMWVQPGPRYAYVEPVATDPAYRRLGLGRAAVLEGIRRCAALGAQTAYVGSDQLFYRSFGFQPLYKGVFWVKTFPA